MSEKKEFETVRRTKGAKDHRQEEQGEQEQEEGGVTKREGAVQGK